MIFTQGRHKNDVIIIIMFFKLVSVHCNNMCGKVTCYYIQNYKTLLAAMVFQDPNDVLKNGQVRCKLSIHARNWHVNL